MSYVGKNIKKIRSVKNLNQSQFADLFELKRASIGAYEEGRAEPKIATLMQIAKHFGITTDDLLNKELSVNDLYHFDIFKKDYVKNQGNQLRPSKLPISLSPVYYIAAEKRNQYFKDANLEALLKLNFPLPPIKTTYLSFEADPGQSWLNEAGKAIDLLIVRDLEDRKEWPVALNRVALLWTGTKFLLGKVESKDKKPGLRDFRHAEFTELNGKEQRLFLVQYELANVLSN